MLETYWNRFQSHPLVSRRNGVILLLFVTGLLLFLSIYDAVQEKDDFASLDVPVLEWALAQNNQLLAQALRIITDCTSPTAIGIITLVGSGLWMWRKKEYWRPTLLIGGVSLALLSAAVIKAFTARERPTITDLLEANPAVAYSFPSGHTVAIAIFVFIMSYLIFSQRRTITSFIILTLSSVICITVVAFSRIYLGYHWLTDVTASVGLALIVLALVIAVDTYTPWTAKNRYFRSGLR